MHVTERVREQWVQMERGEGKWGRGYVRTDEIQS